MQQCADRMEVPVPQCQIRVRHGVTGQMNRQQRCIVTLLPGRNRGFLVLIADPQEQIGNQQLIGIQRSALQRAIDKPVLFTTAVDLMHLPVMTQVAIQGPVGLMTTGSPLESTVRVIVPVAFGLLDEVGVAPS